MSNVRTENTFAIMFLFVSGKFGRLPARRERYWVKMDRTVKRALFVFARGFMNFSEVFIYGFAFSVALSRFRQGPRIEG